MNTDEKKEAKRALEHGMAHCKTYCIDVPLSMCRDCHFYKKMICVAHDWYTKDRVFHVVAGMSKYLLKEYRVWRRKTGQYRNYVE